MTLIGLIVVLAIVGVLLWAVNTLIPMQPQIKTIINVVVVIAVLLWLLEAFGLLGGTGSSGILTHRITELDRGQRAGESASVAVSAPPEQSLFETYPGVFGD
jgi:hypothetical protein